MRREIAALAAITLAVSILAACGVETSEVSMPPANTELPADTALEDWSAENAQTLRELSGLLGMTDGESAAVLGGGEQNLAGDGTTLIGRIYTAELFGETVKPTTMYDASGRVSTVSVYLAGTESSLYYNALENAYGEPSDASAAAGESGSTWVSWDMDGARLKLIQGYGICSLEISAAPAE